MILSHHLGNTGVLLDLLECNIPTPNFIFLWVNEIQELATHWHHTLSCKLHNRAVNFSVSFIFNISWYLMWGLMKKEKKIRTTKSKYSDYFFSFYFLFCTQKFIFIFLNCFRIQKFIILNVWHWKESQPFNIITS